MSNPIHFFRGKTVLVTGASGFVGIALIRALSEIGATIICQSRSQRPDKRGIRWVKHNLTSDSWDCLAPFSIDVVYHLAAHTSVYEAMHDPIGNLLINVHGLLRLQEYFRTKELSPFIILAGTATQVGLTKSSPINETIPDSPVTFYDLSKLTAELYLKQYISNGLSRGSVLRFTNVYGQQSRDSQGGRGILNNIYYKALSGDTINIYGDGGYLRDYIYIDDVVSALVACAEHQSQTNGRTFYVGTGKSILLKDAFFKVAELAAGKVGCGAKFNCVTPPKDLSCIELRTVEFDCSAFSKATGWSPKYDFDTGIAAAYAGEYINDNLDTGQHD